MVLSNKVPVSESAQFILLLTQLNIPTEAKMYEGWTHTDIIFEGPYIGNHLYHRDIYQLVCLWTDHTIPFDDTHPILLPLCPSMLVKAARFCNPF